MQSGNGAERQQTQSFISLSKLKNYMLKLPSTSTPPPKAGIMHSNTTQHPNQIVQSAVANSLSTSASAQIHLDQLNQHYMSASNGGGAGVNANGVMGAHQQQHQINQHYSYNHQATGGSSNQHQLAVITSNHDQPYPHQQQQNHHHQQQQHQHQQLTQQPQQPNTQSPQSLYHHLANNAASVNVGNIYSNTTNSNHYQGHLQGTGSAHQPNHLISGAHHNHLNTAAAACAAAAVVSQTLKNVANQHSQQHHYGGSIANGFGATTGSLMNMTAQHHQQFGSINTLNHNHHLSNQGSISHHHQQPQHQQNHSVHHAATMVTRKYQCKMCPQVSSSGL